MLLNSNLFEGIKMFFSNSVKVNSLNEGADIYGGATMYSNGIYANFEEDNYININEGSNKLSVFVPSTVNCSDKLSEAAMNYFINKYMNIIRKVYNGNDIMAFSTQGSYKCENGEILIEDITIITLSLESVENDDVRFFLELGNRIAKEMTQECVSVSINNSLCLV